ncbi:MAG: Translation initiation factor 5A [archaeon GW2011_AR20]|nr:MAG: Translation initiation factor 5A [archaeon GW2011_AR20]MBS3160681.1 translation initiation factor IF-5A [Candidatus Woesearchaeota archaeon]
MDKKVVTVGSLRVGGYVVIDNAPCVIKDIQISKPGKHGSTKARVEAMGVFDDKKRIFISPTSDKIDVPIVEKKEAQVLSVHENKANVMDIETYETFDILIPDELKNQIKEGIQVVYWVVMDQKIIRQVK